ncbi:hypothetical protein C2G38_2266531 [Gigaspora rosea]|uniref:Uncharacterized protein n=1 Tax=Gigaspora rosea TaxID=44941 RepID=A0A397VVE3_9GLOM|nr:hypothetical protein C2G38_2266531 [Gigaspora rosea]
MTDIEEIIDLYAEIPSFHEDYKYLLNKLPPSLINDAWKRLITRKRNSLTKIEASYINSEIESFLKREIERYNRQKLQYYKEVETKSHCIVIPVSNPEKSGLEEETKSRISNSSSNSLLYNTNIAPLYSEEEVNARIKEATDNLYQELIKSTEETLKTIKQQKDIKCNQIKIDMAN